MASKSEKNQKKPQAKQIELLEESLVLPQETNAANGCFERLLQTTACVKGARIVMHFALQMCEENRIIQGTGRWCHIN